MCGQLDFVCHQRRHLPGCLQRPAKALVAPRGTPGQTGGASGSACCAAVFGGMDMGVTCREVFGALTLAHLERAASDSFSRKGNHRK